MSMFSVLQSKNEIKAEKSLSKILNLELCQKQIPKNEIIIDENNNCVTNLIAMENGCPCMGIIIIVLIK